MRQTSRVVALNGMPSTFNRHVAAVWEARGQLTGIFFQEDIAAGASDDQGWTADPVERVPHSSPQPQLVFASEGPSPWIPFPCPASIRKLSKIIQKAHSKEAGLTVWVKSESSCDKVIDSIQDRWLRHEFADLRNAGGMEVGPGIDQYQCP